MADLERVIVLLPAYNEAATIAEVVTGFREAGFDDVLIVGGDSDDIRNAGSIPVIEGLLKRGASVAAYDSVAADEMPKRFPDIDTPTRAPLHSTALAPPYS